MAFTTLCSDSMDADTVYRMTGAAESLYTSKLCRGRNNNHIVPVRSRK